MHFYHLYLFFCELLFMSPIHFSPYSNISYSLVRKLSTLGVFIFPLCASKIFFSLWFWFAFQSQNCVFFPTEGPLTFIQLKSSYLFQSSIFLHILWNSYTWIPSLSCRWSLFLLQSLSFELYAERTLLWYLSDSEPPCSTSESKSFIPQWFFFFFKWERHEGWHWFTGFAFWW